VRHAVLAVQDRHIHLGGKLHRAWDARSSWKAMIGLRSRAPIPDNSFVALCRMCLDRAFAEPVHMLHYITAVVFYAAASEGDAGCITASP
jgi:hypothetical protein